MAEPTLEPMERVAREIAKRVDAGCPPGVGFCLMLFTFGEGGFSTYISNAERDDMIAGVRELLTKLEAS